MSDIINNTEAVQLLEIAKSYYESTSDNVIGVGYGYKIKDEKMTDEKCVIFSVQKKLPISDVPESEIIPASINSPDGQFIKTDVVEKKYKFLACDPAFTNWQNNPPTNRDKFRPLKGGISTTNVTALSNYVGTMGFIARDDQDGCLVGVSNNHVFIDDAFICSERVNGSKTNIVHHQVLQPNEYNSDLNNSIGFVKRYWPVKSNQTNTVDAALCTLKAEDIDASESYKQNGLSINNFLSFATTEEIDSLIDNSFDIFSSGRTTGAKGEGLVKLKISQVNSVVSIEYEKQGQPTVLTFGNCLHFIATTNNLKPYSEVCNFPIAAGDSGSALIADINGIKKIIGLVFAGSVNQYNICVEGLANRIDEVAAKLSISAWEGGVLKFNTDKIKVFTSNLYNDAASLQHNGERYWQMGFYENGVHDFDSSIFDDHQPIISPGSITRV